MVQHKIPRIGIYAGTFDPVHAGHIAFALQAMQAARLDEVVFLPERLPRHKPSAEHYGHRVAMLTRALQPHPSFSVLETADKRFTVKRTLPALQAVWPGAELVLVAGSDMVIDMADWPYVDRLLASCELVVGIRGDAVEAAVTATLNSLPTPPLASYVLCSHAPTVSSSRIRQALRANHAAAGLLASVHRYARQEWLYVTPLTAV